MRVSTAPRTRAPLVSDDDDGFVAAARGRVRQRVRDQRQARDGDERLGDARIGSREADAEAGGENHGLRDAIGGGGPSEPS